MKNFTLMLFFSLLFATGFAQLPNEGFENTWTPLTGTSGLAGPTGWAIINNAGTTVTWAQGNGGSAQPAYESAHSAFLNNENVGPGNLSDDWLITPAFPMPENGQLTFRSRLFFNLDQGTQFKVMITDETGTLTQQLNMAAYDELESWTELELNPQQTQWVKKTVNIDNTLFPVGTPVHIAFVMMGNAGERWVIDNVSVLSQCPDPTNLSAVVTDVDEAELSWDNPDVTSWEIEVQQDNVSFTGTGVPYSGTLPYVATGLLQDTEYKYLVRAVCADNESEWVGPFNFRTAKYGDSCTLPITVSSLPFTSSDNTVTFQDNINGSAGTGCASGDYLNGNDVIYAYTPAATGVVSLNLTNITDDYAGMFVYTSCANIGINCYQGAVNDFMQTTDLNISQMAVTAGTTYYIVISTWFATSTGYTLNIQQENCDAPTNLNTSGASTTGITVNWTEAGTATSWQYVYQAVGIGLPMGAGTPVTSPSATLTLPAASQYEFYVRANCGNGTFSSWTGPYIFNTLCDVFPTPFFEGFNSDSATQFCWTVANLEGPESTWNLDFADEVYEGDEAAQFDASMNGADNNDMLISPAIQLTGNQRLKFRFKTDDFGAIAYKVVLSTTGTDPEDFTTELFPLTSYANSSFMEKAISLANIPAGPVYVAWQVPGGLNAGYQLLLDNVIIEDLPACAEPTELTTSNITGTTATISWTAGSDETAWEVFIADPDTGIIPDDTTSGLPATNPYPATGLTPGTFYTIYVRSMCGTDGNSSWTGPIFFTTGCNAVAVPFFEGFNSDSETQLCWTVRNANGDWASWDMDNNNAFEGDEAANMYTGNAPNNDWLISPAITLTANQRLTYHYKVEGNTTFKVLLSTSQTDIADFTEVLVPETAYDNTGYKKKVVSLAGYTGTIYIAWQVPPADEYGEELFIDNVIVEPIPACAEPLDIVVSDITQNSADISWTAGGTETAWEVIVYADGQDVPATGQAAATNSATVTTLADGTPLQSGTVYHVIVKSVCGEGVTSNPSDVVDFVTQISNDDCDTATIIPVNVGPACDVYASGTLNGATASPQENPCGDWTNADDDVWFQFTATNALHTLSFLDISSNGSTFPGGNTSLMYVIYEGNGCGSLTQWGGGCFTAYNEYGLESNTALMNNLTVGNVYTIRVFSPDEDTNQTSTFKICVKVPVQPVSVSTTEYTVEQLVSDVLFGESCTQVSNVTWSTGTNFPDPDNIFGDNPNGIGYFNQNGSPFPLTEGIVMTTGDVTRVPGPAYTSMEQGSAVWLGDTDIDAVMENMLGGPPFQPSTNASIIEFDFIPATPTLNLDFLFASMEYGDYIQCYSYDTFALLLTGPDGVTQNIAVIPETDDAISVWNISGAAYPGVCPGYNLPYFAQYNIFGQNDYSPTSFAGQTVVMTATAPLQVNQQYHLKIAIAETDNNLDSGVFIQGGANAIANLDLGVDLLVATNNAICANEEVTISTGLSDATFDFEWTKGGELIPNQTTPNLVVTEPGTYGVTATLTGTSCEVTDEVVIEFYPAVEDIVANPTDLTVCDADGFATFDLSQNTATILTGLNPADYAVSYHTTETEAVANTGALDLSYQNTTQFEQTIYVRIYNNVTQCYGIKTFKLIVQNLTPDFTLTGDATICAASNVTLNITPANFDPADDDVTITWTFNGGTLPDTTTSITVTDAGIYTVTVNNSGCITTKQVTVTVTPSPVADVVADIAVCDSYTLLPLSTDNAYYTGTNGTGTQLYAGDVIIDTQLIYVYAQSGTNTDCFDEISFTVTVTPSPEIDLAQNCNDDNEYELSIIFLNDTYNQDNAIFAWEGPKSGSGTTLVITNPGTYTVTITPLNGSCAIEASIEVDDTMCEVQRGISPNNDGFNDNFELTALGVKTISIFNRYGKEVYHKTNYTNEWHGQTGSGDELPTGTYFYTFERTNGETKTGWIYVNRQDN
ncbi:choice-of-anchor J domain-containing protein [Flavobacterium zepuense]|nr:choice-of-anchor J domain-containing protein [Flavobacterium zepuense]